MKLVKELQKSDKLNPFNDNYSFDEMNQVISNFREADRERQIGFSTVIFNEYYKKYCYWIEQCIKTSNQSLEEICRDIIKIANYDAIYAENNLMKKIKKKKFFEIADISSASITQENNGENSLNLIQTMEIGIDICNTLFNMLKHCNVEIRNGKKHDIGNLKILFQAGNLLCVLKDAYDTLIWEKGYIEEGENSITIKYIDEKIPLLKKIGEDRMNANEIANIFESSYCKNSEVFSIQESEYVLGSIKKNRYLEYFLKRKTKDKDYANGWIIKSAMAQIEIYYPYFAKEKLDKFGGLCIIDLINIWDKVERLFNMSYRSVKIYNTWNECEFCIKRKELEEYLKAVTSYKKSQIKDVIDLFSCSLNKNERIDFWKKPLFESNGDIYFLKSAISAPNILFYVDYWLARAGYTLEKKGKVFEKYIKKELEEILQKKEYYHYIPSQNKFSNSKNKTEEIDLVISLKQICLIGEVKCLKYPMNPREYHNRMKAIKKAAIQVQRKKEFIKMNLENLKKSLKIEPGKLVTGVIITNLPLFTGLIVNEIPVIDYNLFKSYFEPGGLRTIYKGDGVSEEYFEPYYSNEISMSMQLRSFLECPLSIKKRLKNYSLEPQLVTLKDEEYPIYMEFAEKTK